KRAENVLDESVESILSKLDVPSKEDVDALSKKIGDLTNKVSALSEREKKVA
ncbi:MAG: phasin family protein, partial [Caldilineaceae bacterium]|nr:phasin family protein [Caldilineaceae bacterium]